MKLLPRTRERFESKFCIAPTGCWLWQKHKDPGGYGIFSHKHTAYKAHRFAFMLYVGEIPDGLKVCHKCDVRSCVNPSHLFLGTQKDNVQDCVAKGRRSRLVGPKTGFKYKQETIDAIRKDYADGIAQSKIAKKFGIDASYVSQILHNKVWNREPAKEIK